MNFKEKLNMINKLYFNENYQELNTNNLTQIENNLKINLPRQLKEFYMIFSKKEEFLKIINNILLPNKLYIENNILVLVEENQNICSYGIEIKSHKIFYLSNNFKEELEFDIEDFLIYILALQGTGYLDCVGELESNFIDIVKQNFIKITKTEEKGAVYCNKDAILVNTGNNIFICTKDDKTMEQIENKYNLLIDYL